MQLSCNGVRLEVEVHGPDDGEPLLMIMGLGMRVGETMVHVAPLYHSAALNLLLFSGVMLGATHVLLPAFDPDEVIATLERERATIFFGVPTMLAYMLRSPRMAASDLSHLRGILYGAAPPDAFIRGIQTVVPGASLTP